MHRMLERCRAGLRSSLAGLTPADAEASDDGKWSIANIVEHLDLTYSTNIAAVEHRLRKGAPARRRVTLKQHAVRIVVTRMGYFPTGVAAPAEVLPQGRRFAELSAVVEPHLMLLDQRLKEAARAFGVRTPLLNHPIMGPFSVADWRRFHWAHTRHHLRQIEEKSKVRSQKSEAR